MKPSLGKNALLNGLYQLLNVLFPLISGMYLARILEPEGVGQVAYARNIVSWFVMLAALGIPAYGVREMARTQDATGRSRLFSELMALNFLSTVVCLAGYSIFAVTILGGSPLSLVFGLELVFQFLSMDWFFQGREDYGYITLRSLLVKLACLLALFLFVKTRQNVISYALILCLGTGGNAVCNALHARRYVRLTCRGLNIRRHWKPILTLMLSAVTASLYCKLDIAMLGWLGSTPEVGYYTNAHKVVSIVLALAASVSAVFLPRLSYVYRHERERYDGYLSAGLKLVLLLALPCCAGLMLVAEELTAVLFGPLFLPAAATIRILAVLIPVKGVGDLLCYQAIISAGQEKHLIAARVAAGLANGVLNALLIPQWGHNGAALASVVSEIMVNGLLLGRSLKICRPVLEKDFLLSLLICTGAMLGAVLQLRRWAQQDAWSLALSVAAGAAVYGAGVLLLKKHILGGSLCTIRFPRQGK